MPKDVNWDSSFKTYPPDTENVSLGALRIRETRTGVEERLATEHYFGTGDGDEEGRHKFPTGDSVARDALVGVVDQMIYFLQEAGKVYVQLRLSGAWEDIRAREADNADTVDGAHAGNSAGNVLLLDSSGLVPLDNIPSTLTGKDADTVDGHEAADFALNDLSNVDASYVYAKSFPPGTKMLFVSSLPPGWTLDTTFTDKVLRVVSDDTAVGTTGGSWVISGISSAGSHTHTINSAGAHKHELPYGMYGGGSVNFQGAPFGTGGSFSSNYRHYWDNDEFLTANRVLSSSNGAHTHTMGSAGDHTHTFDGTWRPAYVNVIIGVKS